MPHVDKVLLHSLCYLSCTTMGQELHLFFSQQEKLNKLEKTPEVYRKCPFDFQLHYPDLRFSLITNTTS